jgi:hypothetical protein
MLKRLVATRLPVEMATRLRKVQVLERMARLKLEVLGLVLPRRV